MSDPISFDDETSVPVPKHTVKVVDLTKKELEIKTPDGEVFRVMKGTLVCYAKDKTGQPYTVDNIDVNFQIGEEPDVDLRKPDGNFVNTTCKHLRPYHKEEDSSDEESMSPEDDDERLKDVEAATPEEDDWEIVTEEEDEMTEPAVSPPLNLEDRESQQSELHLPERSPSPTPPTAAVREEVEEEDLESSEDEESCDEDPPNAVAVSQGSKADPRQRARCNQRVYNPHSSHRYGYGMNPRASPFAPRKPARRHVLYANSPDPFEMSPYGDWPFAPRRQPARRRPAAYVNGGLFGGGLFDLF